MIKNTILLSVTLNAITSTNMLANVQAKTSFTLGDIVHIESCDKWQWCKLKDNSGYIKGHHFEKFPKDPTIAIKHTKGSTYLYNKRPIYDDKPLFEFIQKEEMLFSQDQDNYKYGYVREKDMANYNKYIKANKSLQDKNNQKIKKADVKIVEEKAETNEALNEVKLDDTNEVVSDTKEELKEIKEVKSKYFIYGGISATSASVDEGTNVVTTDIKDTYTLIEAGLGYTYNPNIFTTLSMQKASNSQTELMHFLLSANYQLPDTFMNPFVGVVGGYGELKWKENPISSLQTTKDITASSYFLGLQGGIKYPLNDSFSLYGTYQYLPTNFETVITNKGEIKHKTMKNLIIGVKYEL